MMTSLGNHGNHCFFEHDFSLPLLWATLLLNMNF